MLTGQISHLSCHCPVNFEIEFRTLEKLFFARVHILLDDTRLKLSEAEGLIGIRALRTEILAEQC